jgi:hypothetical protein
MKRTLSVLSLFILLIMKPANAQTGACCVDEECVDTMSEDACWWMCGYWYEGEDCDQGFECPTDYPCGFYVVGDYNGSGQLNVADIVEMYSKLKTGSPVYPDLLCECPPDSGNFWPVRGDVNNSCTFNIADVVIAMGHGWIPERCLRPCAYCPPAPEP